jgi:hypothetical protein
MAWFFAACAIGRRYLLLLFGVLMTSAAIASTQAAAPETVYFAGAAFTGGVQSAQQSLPITERVLGQEGLVAVNRQLLAALAATPPQYLCLEHAELAALDGSTSATVVAVAIDRETLLIERIGALHKVVFEVAAQALFFDFRDKQIRYSLPITPQYIEVFDQEPTSEQVEAIARRLLLSLEDNSLASTFVAELQQRRLPSAASRRMQLTDVSVSDAVRERWPTLAQRVDAGVVGQEASKLLSRNWQLGLLPYQTGQAIGNAMAARFADGSVYNLSIPKPDYRISLRLEELRSGIAKETPAFRQQAFATRFTIVVDEPLSGRAYFDRALVHQGLRTMPATQGAVDEAAAFYETLLGGIDGFAAAAMDKRSPWLRQQPDRRALSKQMNSLSELIASCR